MNAKPGMNGSGRVTMRELAEGAARAHGLTLADLRGPSRAQRIVNARWQAMRETRALLGYSSTQIGRFFNRDHTTVLHALRRPHVG